MVSRAELRSTTWKDFCRFVEGKKARARIPGVVEKVDACRMFDMTDTDMPSSSGPLVRGPDDPPLLPPLPFPDIAVWDGYGVHVIRDGVFDEDGNMDCEVMVYSSNMSSGMLDHSRCKISASEMTFNGYPKIEVLDITTIDNDPSEGSAASVNKTRRRAERQRREVSRKRRVLSDITGPLAKKFDEMDKLCDSLDHLADQEEELIAKRKGYGAEMMITSVQLALSWVRYINLPSNFIIQQSPENPRRRSKPGRVRRAGERERHVILDKKEIKTRWTESQREEGRSSPIPHLRRGHYRTLSAERYGKKRGQRVWVRATHVAGETVEWKQGGVSYKVL